LAGLLRRWIDPSQGLYLHRTAQHTPKRIYTFIPGAELEYMTPTFELSKIIHSLNHTPIGTDYPTYIKHRKRWIQ